MRWPAIGDYMHTCIYMYIYALALVRESGSFIASCSAAKEQIRLLVVKSEIGIVFLERLRHSRYANFIRPMQHCAAQHVTKYKRTE